MVRKLSWVAVVLGTLAGLLIGGVLLYFFLSWLVPKEYMIWDADWW